MTKGLPDFALSGLDKVVPRGKARVHQTLDISKMGIAELIDLRDAIDTKLPATTLKEIDLAQELVLQYMRVREFQSNVLADTGEEPNKIASAVNACQATLTQLVKLQADLHTAERFKAVENLMIEAMRKLPAEVAESFLDEYEAMGNGKE